MADLEMIRNFGVEPDPERYTYDANACSWCQQPLLIVQSREVNSGYRSEAIACENCLAKLSKRTRAREFRWVFLKGWRPGQ